MNQSERSEELQRLEMVLQKIQLQLALENDTLRGSRKGLSDALSAYWEDNSGNLWDQAQQAEAVDRQRSLTTASYQRKSRYEKMAKSPYFGRIDFSEDGSQSTSEQVYIGIASLLDLETGVYLIYDWRSPIAGMFYDYEPGRAEYRCPVGIIIGRLTLKRQYIITDGQMVSMFDTDLKIDDEILQEILGKSADTKMRTIVNSIQREQNRAIRDELHRLLLVQGPAGSGKTSIALHRAAYLLYLERNAITARNILILSPNQIFSDYISNVLPELGEENILQTTFRDYIKNFQSLFPAEFEERDAQLEYLLSSSDNSTYRIRAAAIQYKSSPEFAVVIRNYLTFLGDYLVRDCPEIKFQGRIILSREEWETLYRELLIYLPPTKRLAEIKRRVLVKLRPLTHQLRRERELAIASSGEEVNEKTIKAMARLAARKELDPLLTELDRLTTLNPFNLYRKLFENDALFDQLATGTKVSKDWPEIRAQTLAWFDEGHIPYEDSLLLIFFQGSLDGFPQKNGIRHLIIDEAQDYSVLQYEILKCLFPESSWTILGDPDQSIHPFLQTADFTTIAGIFDVESALNIRLNRSYRSTREIQSFCRSLLCDTESIEQVNRAGLRPEVLKIKSQQLLPEAITQKIGELKKTGCQSIAVICKTARDAAMVYQDLPNKNELTLVTSEDGEFQSGILIIPIYLAKGLEFDAVLIHDASPEAYEREEDRKLLYIACTRALHRLVLFYIGELSPLVPSLSLDLYQLINE